MNNITLHYALTDKGQRELLKQRLGINTSTLTLIIDPEHESYNTLIDLVKDPNVLEFCCQSKSPNNKLFIVTGDNLYPHIKVSLHEWNDDIYIESDSPLTLNDIPYITQVFLLITKTKEQIKIKIQELEDKARDAAQKLWLGINCCLVGSLNVSSFDDLLLQLKSNTFAPTLVFRYFFTKEATEFLFSRCGWINEFPEIKENVPIPCHVFMAKDIAEKGYPSDLTIQEEETVACKITGYSNDLYTLHIPIKTEYEKVIEAESQKSNKQEMREQRRQEYIENEASPYIKRLVTDEKNYYHLVDREILTKYYPNAVIFKQYVSDKYKNRSCPTPKNYLFLESIQATYPNNECNIKWLDIMDDNDKKGWSGCVIVMKTDYDFDVVFGYPVDHASESQLPLTEDEIKAFNSL